MAVTALVRLVTLLVSLWRLTAAIHHPEKSDGEHHGPGHYIATEKGHPMLKNSEPEGSGAGTIVVLGFAAAVIIFSLVFAMANSSNKNISVFTWRCVDSVISIFLAVLIFQAIDELVVNSGLLPEEHIVLASVVYAIFLLMLAVGLSYALKGSPSNLSIFAASSAHFVGFGLMHASLIGFEHHSSTLGHAVMILFLVAFVLLVSFVGLFYLKLYTGRTSDPEWMETVDSLENDAGAMALSISMTLVVCHCLTGEFQDINNTEEVHRQERRGMLIYAVALTIFGGFIVLKLFDLEASQSYISRRCGELGATVIAMCMAWAWLLWGKWHFHEHSFENFPMFSRIWYAFLVSLVTMAVIILLGLMPTSRFAEGAVEKIEKQKLLMILTASLVAGWSWEEAFDESLETVAHGRQRTAMIKLGAAVLMLAVVLPVHVIHFKPMAMAAAENFDSKYTV